MNTEFFEDFKRQLSEAAGPMGAVDRGTAARATGYSAKYLANIDSRGDGPERFKRGRKTYYPVQPLVEWFANRVSPA